MKRAGAPARPHKAASPSVQFGAAQTQAPHEANDGALETRQQQQHESERRRYRDRDLQPDRNLRSAGNDEERHDDVADQEDREVGREIVGTDMAELHAAGAAAFDRLQIAAEQPAAAAMRAAHEKAAQHGARGRVLSAMHDDLPSRPL